MVRFIGRIFRNSYRYAAISSAAVAVVLLGCGDKHTFTAADAVVDEDVVSGPANGIPAQAAGESDEEKKRKRPSLSLQIISQRDLKDPEPVELMLVMDTSESVLLDDLPKIEEALPTLVNGLTSEDVPFVTRLVPMSSYLAQVVEKDKFHLPEGMGDGAASYDRSGKGSPYTNIKRFTNELDQADLTSELRSLLPSYGLPEDLKPFSGNEPGLCAMVDYPLWLAHSPQANVESKLGKKRLHVVVVTDEDDKTGPGSENKGYQKHDLYNSGRVESSKPLYCRRQRIETQECKTERFDRLLTFQKYRYTYKKIKRSTKYRHTVRFWKRNKCEILHGSKAGGHDLGELWSQSRYVTNLYECQQYHGSFSCSTNPTDPLQKYTTTPTVSKEGEKRCNFSNGECAYERTKYNCPDLAGGPFYSDQSNVKKICDVATRFECVTYPDGQAKTEQVDRDKALALISLGASCTALPGNSISQEAFVAPNANRLDVGDPGILSCDAVQCTAFTTTTTAIKSWSQTIAELQSGRVCSETGQSVPYDKPISFDESQWGVHDCSEYTCEDQSYYTTHNAIESRRSNYTSCETSAKDTAYNPRTAYKAITGGRPNHLTGIGFRAKPAGYRLEGNLTSHKIDSGLFCKASYEKIADKKDVQFTFKQKAPANAWATEVIDKDYRMSRDEIVTHLRNKFHDPAIQDTPEWVDSLVVTDTVITTETEHDESYTFQKYPKDDPLWSTAVDIKETYTSFVDALDDDTIVVPPVQNRNAANPVIEKIVIRKDGLKTRPSCGPKVLTLDEVAPEPKQILKVFHKEFPQNSFMQHAIVMTKESCAGRTNAGSEIGTKYQELAKLTGGHVGDICSADYKNIVKKIVSAIVNELVTVYPLPEKYFDRLPYSVVNQTRGKVLKPGYDWWVDGDVIVFDKKAVAKDDKIKVEF